MGMSPHEGTKIKMARWMKAEASQNRNARDQTTTGNA